MKERPRFAYSTQDGVARKQSGVGVFELVYFFVEGPYYYKGRIRSYIRPPDYFIPREVLHDNL